MQSQDVANRADLTPAQLSRIENGKHGLRVPTLLRIAEALDVSPSHLLSEGGDPQKVSSEVLQMVACSPIGKALASADFASLANRLAKEYQGNRRGFRKVRDIINLLLEKG